jgi:hypothetical protein
MHLIIEKADDWTPTSERWVCLGPNLFDPSESEHMVTGPQNRSTHVVKDELDCRSVLCRTCAVKLGVEW